MVVVPPTLAYWVRPPAPKLTVRLPSGWLLTATFVSVMVDPEGLISAPLGPKTKLVPALIHAVCVPVAFGLD